MLVKLVSLLSSEVSFRTETVHCLTLAMSYTLHMTMNECEISQERWSGR